MSEPPPLPPSPDDEEIDGEFRIEAECDTCDAPLKWDPKSYSLLCEYCGTSERVPDHGGEIEEYALSEAGAAARGLGLEVRSVRCGNCDARVVFDAASTAENCVYCGSSNVMDQEVNRNAIRPESLVPLGVGQDRVAAAFKKWLHGLWFRPNALKKAKRDTAVGVYVPFWTYDCLVWSDWSAESGTYYYVTETYTTRENGKTVTKTRRVRKTRWRPASGRRRDHYDDVLIPASRGLSRSLLHRLGDFDMSELVPYRPEYLAGFRAEEYQIDLDDGWGAARSTVETSQRTRCAGDIPGDTYRFLSVRNHYRNVTWKHVLLPVWSLTYRFRGKTWPVLVHGQTGRVVGEAPYSWVKITFLVVGILAAIGLIAILVLGTGAAASSM